MDTENRQLNQIITQLRNARKTSQENADTALADKQTYIETIEQQKRELINLKEKFVNYDNIIQEHSQLINEVIIINFIIIFIIIFIILIYFDYVNYFYVG